MGTVVSVLVEPVVDLGVEQPEIGNGEVEDAVAGFLGGRALENVAPEQQVGQADARREDIRTLVGHVETRLLRAHVIHAPRDHFALIVVQQGTIIFLFQVMALMFPELLGLKEITGLALPV